MIKVDFLINGRSALTYKGPEDEVVWQGVPHFSTLERPDFGASRYAKPLLSCIAEQGAAREDFKESAATHAVDSRKEGGPHGSTVA